MEHATNYLGSSTDAQYRSGNQRGSAPRFPQESYPVLPRRLLSQGINVWPSVGNLFQQFRPLHHTRRERHHRNRFAIFDVVAHQLQFKLLRQRN